jgi:hypothetical protein
MASLRYERRIAASADLVWSIITRPESILEWFPGVVSCVVEGTLRTITLASGLVFPEEIICNDALQRRFAYRITSPFFKSHLATVDVIELGESDTLCVYSTTAEPDTLALINAGGTLGALGEIQRIAESRMKG